MLLAVVWSLRARLRPFAVPTLGAIGVTGLVHFVHPLLNLEVQMLWLTGIFLGVWLVGGRIWERLRQP